MRVDDGVFVDGEVARDADLSGQQHISFQHGAAGQTGLRADDIIFAHHAGVADLHQAVDFGAALDAGFAHRGAVHRGEALDLHVVFDHGDAALHDLEMAAVGALGEAEAVAAHHHAILQSHPIADAAKFAHRGMRVRQKIVADLRAFVDHDMGMNHRVAADAARVRPPPQRARWSSLSPITAVAAIEAGDECRGPDSAAGRKGQGAGEIQIRVF